MLFKCLLTKWSLANITDTPLEYYWESPKGCVLKSFCQCQLPCGGLPRSPVFQGTAGKRLTRGSRQPEGASAHNSGAACTVPQGTSFPSGARVILALLQKWSEGPSTTLCHPGPGAALLHLLSE